MIEVGSSYQKFPAEAVENAFLVKKLCGNCFVLSWKMIKFQQGEFLSSQNVF